MAIVKSKLLKQLKKSFPNFSIKDLTKLVEIVLEEIEKKEALDKYGSEDSGKNLPFSSLSEDLKEKEEDKD